MDSYKVTQKDATLKTGTFNECWNWLLNEYRNAMMQQLAENGICLEPNA